MLDYLIYKNANIIYFKTITGVAIAIINGDQSLSYKHHQTITVSTRRNTLHSSRESFNCPIRPLIFLQIRSALLTI